MHVLCALRVAAWHGAANRSSRHAPGILPLHRGARLLLFSKTCDRLGITKGCEVISEDICFHGDEAHQPLLFVGEPYVCEHMPEALLVCVCVCFRCCVAVARLTLALVACRHGASWLAAHYARSLLSVLPFVQACAQCCVLLALRLWPQWPHVRASLRALLLALCQRPRWPQHPHRFACC